MGNSDAAAIFAEMLRLQSEAAQAGNALRLRIAVRVGLAGHFAQLVDHVLRRRQVGVAHAEVDDVTARLACRVAHRVDFGDHVGRQALDAVELVIHDL